MRQGPQYKQEAEKSEYHKCVEVNCSPATPVSVEPAAAEDDQKGQELRLESWLLVISLELLRLLGSRSAD